MLIAFNKPWNVLSQFTDAQGRATLSDYIDIPDVYPAGRLDRDSEGLLLLTDDGALQARITSSDQHWSKTYLAQVEGTPSAKALARLGAGVELNDGPCLPAQVDLLAGKPGWLWPRETAIAPRKGKAVCWLRIRLNEGRNRQVRRMTAAVGLPTLRLVRESVGPVAVNAIAPGELQVIEDYVNLSS